MHILYLIVILKTFLPQEYKKFCTDLVSAPEGYNSVHGVRDTETEASEFKVEVFLLVFVFFPFLLIIMMITDVNNKTDKSAMLVGCGYKDELTSIDSTNVLVANLKPLYCSFGEPEPGFKLATSTFLLSIRESNNKSIGQL